MLPLPLLGLLSRATVGAINTLSNRGYQGSGMCPLTTTVHRRLTGQYG